jgi:hypothetical protein
MEFSPKLKRVMAAIKKILEKEDIAGFVVLHTPGHSEYLNHITPSYSCLKVDKGGNLRFVSKLTDYNGNVQKKRKKEADTANMLSLLSTTAGAQAVSLIDISKHIDWMLDAEHTDLGHRPDNYQDN